MVKILRGTRSILDSLSSKTQLYTCPIEVLNNSRYEGDRDIIRWRGFIDRDGNTNFGYTHYGDTRRGGAFWILVKVLRGIVPTLSEYCDHLGNVKSIFQGSRLEAIWRDCLDNTQSGSTNFRSTLYGDDNHGSCLKRKI